MFGRRGPSQQQQPGAESFAQTGIAVSAGDTVAMLAWSNAAETVRCNLNFRSVGGASPTTFTLPDLAVGSARAQTSVTATVLTDGVFDAGIVVNVAGTIPAQRGQTYIQVVLTRGGTVAGAVVILMADYHFAGNSPTLGHIVSPGPAGGHGMMTSSTSANPAANAEVAALGPPVGAKWLVHTYNVQLVQGITQTPLPTLKFTVRTTGTVGFQIPITTTALAASSTAQLTWGIGIVQSSFTAVVGDEIHTAPLPSRLYLENDGTNADGVATVTDGKGANTDYGAATVVVEEWVMPN